MLNRDALDDENAVKRPSPNFGARKAGLTPSLVILHYTGMRSAEAALERLCDPAAEVSAHYLIDEAGRLFALVDEEARAWHAGVAEWRGEGDVNSVSIGVELVNLGHSAEGGGLYHPFPEPQMVRLEGLLAALRTRWSMGAEGVIAHSDVAPERKRDPGEKFDWARLERRGLALGPAAARSAPSKQGIRPDPERLQAELRSVGYGRWALEATLDAFRRRFAPWRLGLPLAPDDIAAAEALAHRSKATVSL